jgi:hypothetical protein
MSILKNLILRLRAKAIALGLSFDRKVRGLALIVVGLLGYTLSTNLAIAVPLIPILAAGLALVGAFRFAH